SRPRNGSLPNLGPRTCGCRSRTMTKSRQDAWSTKRAKPRGLEKRLVSLPVSEDTAMNLQSAIRNLKLGWRPHAHRCRRLRPELRTDWLWPGDAHAHPWPGLAPWYLETSGQPPGPALPCPYLGPTRAWEVGRARGALDPRRPEWRSLSSA